MIGYGRVSRALSVNYRLCYVVCWVILLLQDMWAGNSNLWGIVVIFYTGVYITTHYCFDICASCDYITTLAVAICPAMPFFPRVPGNCSVLIVVSFVCHFSLGTVSRCVSRWHLRADLFIVNMHRFIQCLAEYTPCIFPWEGFRFWSFVVQNPGASRTRPLGVSL